MKISDALKRSVIAVAIAVTVSGCASLQQEVSQYRGDGIIMDTSWSFYGKPIHGYVIKFPTFRLNRAYEAEYRLENLPALPGKFFEAGLRVTFGSKPGIASQVLREHPLDGHVEVTLLTRGGTRLASSRGTLRERFANHAGRSDPQAVNISYALPSQPRSDERYILRVRYTPGPDAPDLPAYFAVICGGRM